MHTPRLLLLSFVAAVASVSAATVTYQPSTTNPFLTGNYTGLTDVTLDFNTPNSNFGNDRSLRPNAGDNVITMVARGQSFVGSPVVEEQRALMRWDLSSFAGAYASINSVTIVVRVISTTGEFTLKGYSVAAANRDWVEGNSAGGTVAGTSTWNHRTRTTTPWAGSAGLSTPGVDYDLHEWISVRSTSSSWALNGTSQQLTNLVTSWTSPSTNTGLLLVGVIDPEQTTKAGQTYLSSEAAFQPWAPQLVIDYVPIPEPFPAALLAAASGLFVLTWRRRR